MHILRQNGSGIHFKLDLAKGLRHRGNHLRAKQPVDRTISGWIPEARLSQYQSLQIMQRARDQIVYLLVLIRHHDNRGDGKLQSENLGFEHPTLLSGRFRFRHSRMGRMSCHSRQSVWPGKYRRLVPQSLVAEPGNSLANLQNLEITICDLKLKAKIMSQDLVSVPHGMPVQIVDVTGVRVVLDQDLARFFDVETRVLNQSVKRHLERFPKGWAFQLTKAQFDDLKSQDVISSGQWGGRRSPPWAFTEHGVVMVATLLNSPRAVEASQFIVEAFVEMRSDKEGKALLPARMKSDALTSLGSEFLPKLRDQLSAIMDMQANPKRGSTLRDETEELIDKGLANLKSRLAKAGLENEEIEARILKFLAEAEESRARAATEREMTEKQRLKNQANRLRLLIRAEIAMSDGDLGDFLNLLDELGG